MVLALHVKKLHPPEEELSDSHIISMENMGDSEQKKPTSTEKDSDNQKRKLRNRIASSSWERHHVQSTLQVNQNYAYAYIEASVAHHIDVNLEAKNYCHQWIKEIRLILINLEAPVRPFNYLSVSHYLRSPKQLNGLMLTDLDSVWRSQTKTWNQMISRDFMPCIEITWLIFLYWTSESPLLR